MIEYKDKKYECNECGWRGDHPIVVCEHIEVIGKDLIIGGNKIDETIVKSCPKCLRDEHDKEIGLALEKKMIELNILGVSK